MPSSLRRIDGWIWLLLLIGVFIFIIKCHIVYPIEYVGHADASGYAEMADSLVHGRGLEVDYISFYFLKYKEINRPEDHWPPLYSFLIAPFFLIIGKTAFAAKLPALIISCFFFPLVGYLLAKHFSNSGIVGFATGIHILIYPEFFRHSLYCLSDVTFAFMVCLTVLFAIKGLEDGRYFYPMGVAMGLAYYAKGAGLIIIPAYVLFYLICRSRASRVGWKIPTLQKTDWQFIIGLGLAFLTMFPWFIRNMAHFGLADFYNPEHNLREFLGSAIFSTQKFAAGYIGYLPWEEGTYRLYWGEGLPSFGTKIQRWGIPAVIEKTKASFEQHLWWAFIDIKSSPGRFESSRFSTYFTGIPAAVGLVMLAISSIYSLQLKWTLPLVRYIVRRGNLTESPLVTHGTQIWQRVHADVWRVLRPWHNPRLHIVWLIPLFLFSFLSLCWEPISRLAFPATPLVIATGWTSYYIAARGLFRRLNYQDLIASAITFLLLIIVSLHCGGLIHEAWKRGGYPYREGGKAWIEAGRWIKENIPESVTMTRNPWELHFYSEEKAIQIPLEELDRIIEVGKYYGATHLIPENRRPALKKWLSGEIPGLELVYDEGLEIYKIHYDRLPRELQP